MAEVSPGVRACRVCGCRHDTACVDVGGPCWWVETDLCSHCDNPDPARRRPPLAFAYPLDEIDDDDHDDCPNCDGDGFVEDCFEDTCVCLDPPCRWLRCDYCNHDGRKKR